MCLFYFFVTTWNICIVYFDLVLTGAIVWMADCFWLFEYIFKLIRILIIFHWTVMILLWYIKYFRDFLEKTYSKNKYLILIKNIRIPRWWICSKLTKHRIKRNYADLRIICRVNRTNKGSIYILHINAQIDN